MKIKINGNYLAGTLRRVERVVNFKHSIPILQGILIECTQEEITLVGSDAHEALRLHLPVDGENADVLEPGRAVLPKQGLDLFKKIKQDMTLELNDAELTVQYGKSKVTLNVLDATEFPRLPGIKTEKPLIKLKGKDLGALIKKTLPSVSASEIRPILTGVCWNVENNLLTLVATDSHRLAQIQMPTESEDGKFVVPGKSIELMEKIFDFSEDVEVFPDPNGNMMMFKNGPLFLFSRLLEGNYPETSKLIPSVFTSEVKFNRMEMIDAMDRISALINSVENGRSGVVKLTVNGAVEISSHSSQIGKGIEVFEHEEFTGEEFSIAFSAKYMVDALKTIDTESVVLKYQGSMRPFVVVPEESPYSETQLILPVRSY